MIVGHCSICLSDIEKKEAYTLACKHTYHDVCIATWREQNITCPICRTNIPLSCNEKCNVCMSLPNTRCAFEIIRVFLFPAIVLIIVIWVLSENSILRK